MEKNIEFRNRFLNSCLLNYKDTFFSSMFLTGLDWIQTHKIFCRGKVSKAIALVIFAQYIMCFCLDFSSFHPIYRHSLYINVFLLSLAIISPIFYKFAFAVINYYNFVSILCLKLKIYKKFLFSSVFKYMKYVKIPSLTTFLHFPWCNHIWLSLNKMYKWTL